MWITIRNGGQCQKAEVVFANKLSTVADVVQLNKIALAAGQIIVQRKDRQRQDQRKANRDRDV